MTGKDPAVEQARKQLGARNVKGAVATYEGRIAELNARSVSRGLGVGHAVVSGLVIGIIVAIALSVTMIALDDNSSEQSATNSVVNELPTPLPSTPTDLPPTPTLAPTVAPTLDCGAWEWWNYTAGPVQDFLEAAKRETETMLDPEAEEGTLNIVHDINSSTRDEKYDIVRNRAYPMCAREARQALIDGLALYDIHLSDQYWSAIGMDRESFADLETAEEYLAEAAALIATITGEDASFLILENAD